MRRQKDGEHDKKVAYNETAEFNIYADNGYVLSSPNISCSNYTYDNGKLTFSNVMSDLECNIELEKKQTQTETTYYKATIKVENGTSNKTNITVKKGNTATFNISPSVGFTSLNPTIECTNGQAYSYSGTTLKITNLKSNTTCTVKLKTATLKVQMDIVGSNPQTSYIEYGKDVSFMIKKRGYDDAVPSLSSISCSPEIKVIINAYKEDNNDETTRYFVITLKNVKEQTYCSGRLNFVL